MSPDADWSNMQCNNWIYVVEELQHTPGAHDGISWNEEINTRYKGASFALNVCMQIKLPAPTIYVATTLLQRFYMRFSVKNYHPYNIAATCVFLASKVEETHRKVDDIVLACLRVAQKKPTLQLDKQDKDYWKWRDIILFNETILLEAICFDLSSFDQPTPFQYLIKYIRQLFPKLEQPQLHKAAWSFINDSARSHLCLLFRPSTIAVAAIYQASFLTSVQIAPPQNASAWWDELGVPLQDIKGVIRIMDETYARKQEKIPSHQHAESNSLV
ncbi:cyclin-like protein [Limtongia smithiae]|uniref:cyclin-like protein n=1 Tax=Limtongia smithiae TaxID=1125753 RepID=UPI0034CDC95C